MTNEISGNNFATLRSRLLTIKVPVEFKTINVLSVEDVSHVQNDLNLSVRQTNRLCKNLRESSGTRKFIQSGLKT